MNEALLNTAIRTIRLEAQSVAGLTKFIDEDFEKIVEIVFNSKGRLVVSGIGKSAIIAQKIVATLNSTGTPSVFMHAGDAIHGDLGMIGNEDVVMLISKSGESPEIKVLVPLIRNFGNILIAMCGNPESFLVRNCNYFLNTTVNKEACPNNLAPTSSTTVQMVMGDAIAVCLMEKAGFNGVDFAKFHPGGNLGKRLYLRVRDLYVFNAKPVIQATAGLKEIIMQMTKGRLGATAVASEQGKIIGIITDGDLRRMLETAATLEHIKAADILSPDPKTITDDELAVKALEVLRNNDISQLVVIDKDYNYLGMLHLHDLVKEGIV
jgi:arabinose-5-phosphate isomerase